MKKFQEYKNLDLSQINKDILAWWHTNDTFKKSLNIRKDSPAFLFYEGPPSANGLPGIHHVISRSIKDIFCRYKTMKGYLVERKAGWDTHGLPVEIGVEKSLGIVKDDIGKKISISDYNKECRKQVLQFTDQWEDLTEKMGYWVDMHDPYVTCDNRYIETLWWLLKELYKKGLLYKGYTIQPYSPAAGTGLSTHELNQPGCYRDVKDTTCVAQFKLKRDENSEFKFYNTIAQYQKFKDIYFLAWTTTPWTLPSNTALAVGKNIEYLLVKTIQPYTLIPICVILAKDLFSKYFHCESDNVKVGDYCDIFSGINNTLSWDHDFSVSNLSQKHKIAQWEIVNSYHGSELEGTKYEQLIPWVNPGEGAFLVISGDFVSTEEGTGIVHIAPTFGADDDRAAKASGIPPLVLFDKAGTRQPMVDRTGKYFKIEDLDPEFISERLNTALYNNFAGRYVKNEYSDSPVSDETTLDIDLCVMLKQQGLAFKIEKHIHTYPHCWRTDKPILYYPLDSWFIKTTAVKDRMIELNNSINWKPQSTGSGRFGKWLENLQDWNLSRSRFWGTPLPVWRSEDGLEERCIGSVAELKSEIDNSILAGFMTINPLANFNTEDNSSDNYGQIDLHRPFVDDIYLVSESGKKMVREKDLVDVWFDSGSMPYAQIHYPFEHTSRFVPSKNEGQQTNSSRFGFPFPADFIAEGVDQTRGWFFTLHAIAVMLFDSVAFKNIVSNGHILDINGNKMSKRLGNGIDPFETIEKYGSDPLRWYMITNSAPWDNIKFDINGIDEVTRKFFGTLYNTYSFFALYANVDGFNVNETQVPVDQRPEIDRWIISLLNSLIKDVDKNYNDYEPTLAGRAIQDFVTEKLSNWYVRLNRKRFWGGIMDADKLSAYQTLHTCLITIAKLGSPISPFYTDQLFIDLTSVSEDNIDSVHLSSFPTYNPALIDKELEEKMDLAQSISSMVLGLRRKVNIKVRQPLQKIMVSILDESMASKIEVMKKLILNEVNVKELAYIPDSFLVKKIKPNFKTLGPKFGKYMKAISANLATFTQHEIATFEKHGNYNIQIENQAFELNLEDVEILSEDIPGWLVATEGKLTVTLDITLNESLLLEGMARELINRIQNIRKEHGYTVTDKIKIEIQRHDALTEAINFHHDYISTQTLAQSIDLVDILTDVNSNDLEIDENVKTLINITRVN